MHDEALERIEVKIAFLERANTELSDVVFSQQRMIDTLRARFATLEARLHAADEAAIAPAMPADERPPHY